MIEKHSPLAVIIPAAGVGKRMQANCPKQYLTIAGKTILQHTVERLLNHPLIDKIVIVLGADDDYFPNTGLKQYAKVETVIGGKERVDSVLAGLASLNQQQFPWVLVHDAARPCVTIKDINKLIEHCLNSGVGGILASPVSDTIKQVNIENTQQPPTNNTTVNITHNIIGKTVDRSLLWCAYTPQMYPTGQLVGAIKQGLQQGLVITDESSAIEQAGHYSQLIVGQSDNIKITQPDDLLLAEFILEKQKNSQEKQDDICE